MTSMKFALCNTAGEPVSWWKTRRLDLIADTVAPAMSHHILVVDRSGSMYGVMPEMREWLQKLLTVEEFANAAMRVSLISYSSSGDYTVHFARTPIAEVMKPGSAAIESVRSLRATAMTCVSQALVKALDLIDPAETTGISIHTDGYFNDRSPAAEKRAIDAWVAKAATKPIFVNCVAYGWADTQILTSIADRLSGRFVNARTIKEMYDALHDTSKLLAGRTAPAITASIGESQFMAALSVQGRKVNGSTTDMQIRGLAAGEVVETWRFTQLTEDGYTRCAEPEAPHLLLLPALWVLARTRLAAGDIRTAKLAAITSRDKELRRDHLRALTVEQLAAFASVLDERLWGQCSVTFDDTIALSAKTPITEIIAILDAHKSDWTLDLPTFMAGYARRGVKTLMGKWVEVDGKRVLQPATTDLVPLDDANLVRVSAFEQNDRAASIQMRVVRPGQLRANGQEVRAVAGIPLVGALSIYNNYSIVADGTVNATVLPIRISSRALHDKLTAAGIITDAYAPTAIVSIPLAQHPLLPASVAAPTPTHADVDNLIDASIRASFYRAANPAGRTALDRSTEQIAALRAVDLTPALNWSPPTARPYTDLDEAIRTGLVDTRTRFSVDLFDARGIAGTTDLFSGNEFLQRHFVVTRGGADVAKPTWADALDPATSVDRKKLSARTVLTEVDDRMLPIALDFLGFSSAPRITAEQAAVRLVAEEARIEMLLSTVLRPLALYIGATGMPPAEWGSVVALDAEALTTRFPRLKLAKGVAESGTFFVLPEDVVVAVYAENALYSTAAGVEAARQIQAAAGVGEVVA